MFRGLKERLSGGAKRMSGRTDLLEAVTAGAALVAAADGKIEADEIEATAKAVMSNETLITAFSPKEIEGSIQRMIDRANGGRVGQMGLYKEIDDISGVSDDAEVVLLTAMDIADADGSVDPAETAVLEKIAGRCGHKLSSYA